MNPIIMAEKARQAMQEQLDTTPKPGLVDKRNAGAHTDMDYGTMQAAIEVLVPHLVTFGQTGLFVARRTDAEVAHIAHEVGVAAIQDMYNATGGVNALKGTLFALGLFITAYYRLFALDHTITAHAMADQIAALARHIQRAKDTHGDWVNESYHVGGALQAAQEGYRTLLADTLPLYRAMTGPDRKVRLFLYLLGHTQDSCLYYRGGAELAQTAATMGDWLYRNYSPEDVTVADDYFIRCHLSPGGCGDMLTLLLLADKVL